VHQGDDGVVIEARAAGNDAECPGCGTRSGRVHGRYQRRLADTPLAGRPAVIRLLVRRFVCAEPGCDRSTFAEQVTGLTAPHGR
jgi:transposase